MNKKYHKKFIRIILINVFLLLCVFIGYSQGFFRIKADFMIKRKLPTGQQQLTIGKVYYDKNVKKIIFDIDFPEKEMWIQKDTNLYKIVDGKVAEKQVTPSIAEFTIYHLALNGNLADYGLKNTEFKIIDIDKEGNSIITTWEPPKKLKKIFGMVLLQNNDQKLTGIVFKDLDDNIVSRQFFRKYTNIGGLNFPQEIVRESIIDGKKSYEITTYKNIIINEDSPYYDYKIPMHQ